MVCKPSEQWKALVLGSMECKSAHFGGENAVCDQGHIQSSVRAEMATAMGGNLLIAKLFSRQQEGSELE